MLKNELVQEEMESGSKVEWNNSMTTIGTFTKQINIVIFDNNNFIKTYQKKIAKDLEAAGLENLLIFQINDKLILESDIS